MTEQPIPSVNDDPASFYIPWGDLPDFTEAEHPGGRSNLSSTCYSPFDMHPGNDNIAYCTRPKTHDGSHVAGCDRIIVIWDPPAYRIQEEPV